jgi:hypothetical protein
VSSGAASGAGGSAAIGVAAAVAGFALQRGHATSGDASGLPHTGQSSAFSVVGTVKSVIKSQGKSFGKAFCGP